MVPVYNKSAKTWITMPEIKLKQLQFENNTWKRLLCFMMDENIHMKNRIAEILKTAVEKNMLEEIENFQNSFIRQDDLIGLLRNDTFELDRLLVREKFEDGKIKKMIDEQLKELRNNINIAEKQFSKLKSEFNNYLLENIEQK